MADSVNVRVSDSGKLYPNAVVVKVRDEEIIAGRDGVSPVVTTEAITHGNRVTITDAVGEHVFDVMNGASAYEQAVAGGYEGTEAEFAEDLAGFSDKADAAEAAAASAAQGAQSAINSASAAATEAQEAAQSAATASTHKDAASSSAQSAANSATSADNSASAAAASASAASGSATSASASESNAANSATNAAASETAAASSATAAGNAQTAAETAQAAAETAQAAAETAQAAAETAQGAAEDAQAAAEAVLASIPEDYTELSGDVNELKSATADYVNKNLYDDTPNKNTIILLNTDVNVGDVVNYEIDSIPTDTATFIEILDTNNSRITYIGKGSSASGDLEYSGTYVIPENFGSAKFITTASTQKITHVKLWIESKQAKFNAEVAKTLETGIDPSYADVKASRNIFTITGITAGAYLGNDNIINTSDSSLYSDYIPVNPGDVIRCTKFTLNPAISLQAYDANKSHIRHYAYTESEQTTHWEATMPNNARYIRLNVYFRDMGQIVITVNTPYDTSLAGQNGNSIAAKDGNIYKGPLYGKRILYNGDSICEGRYAGTSGNGGAYAQLISEITQCGYINYAISGGILASAVPSGNLPNRCVVRDLPDMSNDADLICIEGGYNDYSRNVPIGALTDESDLTGTLDTTTVIGALESIFRQAQAKWLGKPICFVIVHKVQGAYFTNNFASTPYTFKELHDAMIACCNKYAIPYWDGCLESGLNGHNVTQSEAYLTSNASGTSDGTHPNKAGYEKFYVPGILAMFNAIISR